jgi:hypothetical protein
MSIKRRIKFKKQDLHEVDRPRFEEHDEKDYVRHCERFFKGWEDDSKT